VISSHWTLSRCDRIVIAPYSHIICISFKYTSHINERHKSNLGVSDHLEILICSRDRILCFFQLSKSQVITLRSAWNIILQFMFYFYIFRAIRQLHVCQVLYASQETSIGELRDYRDKFVHWSRLKTLGYLLRNKTYEYNFRKKEFRFHKVGNN